MHIMHIALGGCFRPPPVCYGLTEDTGGHIAYVLSAAMAQSRKARISIVTRAFDDHGPDYAAVETPVAPGVTIRRIRGGSSAYLTKSALWDDLRNMRRSFAALLDRQRPDIIHAHFADAAELALDIAGPRGIPVVYTPHSLALDKTAPEARRIRAERRAIRECAAVIVSSADEVERQVHSYAPEVQAIRIAPGPTARSPGALPELALDDPDRPMILSIARPVAKKNLAALVRAYAGSALKDRANLVILAGQHATLEPEAHGVLDGLRQAGAGLGGRFALPPAHDGGHVAALYARAAQTGGVFVNPALFEPFGLTLLEAAAAGLPVVATRHGGPSRIVAELGNGALVDPEPGPIAQACLALLDDRAGWSAAAANGLARIGRYSWERYAEETLHLYGAFSRTAWAAE
ncbi:glycosyltransferase [Falsirhodobacter algicola]|uniref:sucrose-phosphate synthase n=1 Tax=Falsirhodobacter algicola TaxID=2692330 RepID=A0A8J8MUU3_9RHOB|nr:glycosyltransferase [Falsirhodobacter algicola]QUS37127.1 glycosyltransferase [Falsirhodobacter algicola]